MPLIGDLPGLFIVVWIRYYYDFNMSLQSILLKTVTVRSARGLINRTVIADLGEVIVLADPRYEEEAKIAGITKFSVGFRKCDVVAIGGLDSLVCLKHNVQYEQAEHGQAGANRGDDDRGE